MAKNLEEAIQQAGGPVKLLWESKTPPAVVPRVVQEFSNWRDEQLAWRRTAVLFDQSHHMANLNIKGRDALKVISKLAINSVANFPVDMAKQFVAVNHDGYVIGDNILFHLEDDEYQAVGIPPSINWLHYHATTGGYDVRVWRDDNSFYRKGDPVLYRYQVQGPGAMEVIREATGQPPPKLKFFYMTRLKIAGKEVRALRHGMAGEPGLEMWGPWKDNEIIHAALLEAGKKYGITQVGGRAYHTNALESGWLPRPLPAVYSGEKMKPYRQWLTENAYETTSPLGGSFTRQHRGLLLHAVRARLRAHHWLRPRLHRPRGAREDGCRRARTGRRKKVTFVWNGDDCRRRLRLDVPPRHRARSSSTCRCRSTTPSMPTASSRTARSSGYLDLDRLLRQRARDPCRSGTIDAALAQPVHGSDARLGRGRAVAARCRSRSTCRSRSARR